MAQRISYEVSLAVLLVRLLLPLATLRLMRPRPRGGLIIYNLPLALLWVVTCLAETNRRPFDFAEGESELVSGFNTEYSASGFALIFMAEYCRILVLRAARVVLIVAVSPLRALGAGATTLLGAAWV